MSDSLDKLNRDWAERTRQAREDPRSAADIISAALAIDEDEHAHWDLVTLLHFRATPDVLDAAQNLCGSDCLEERKLGSNVLGQLGVPDRAFPEECLATLLETLKREQDAGVLRSICTALGHLSDDRAVPALAGLKGHPSAEVRFDVAMALGGQTDDLAIRTLIELSEDEDADVRDWATFGLGSQLDEDTPAIREALFRRLTDPDEITRGEAMVGLAKRKDERLIGALLEELTPERMARREERSDLLIEAAELLGDPRLVPVLLRLRDSGWDVEDVLERCQEGR